MHKKATVIFLLIAILLFCSCSKPQETLSEPFFPSECVYHVGFQCGNARTLAQIFFDGDGSFHLLHEDTSSPLFGMEEVFTKEGVKSSFHELEFESVPYPGGISVLYPILQTVRTGTPAEKEADGEKMIFRYCTDSADFLFEFRQKDSVPLRILGKYAEEEFTVNFSTEA